MTKTHLVLETWQLLIFMEGDLYTDIVLMWLDTNEMLFFEIKSCPVDQDLKINVSKLCHSQLTTYLQGILVD